MVKIQLLVESASGESGLCVLAGPSFPDLLAALKALPRRTYVAPSFWLVDTVGLARLHAVGLQVKTGCLHPVLAEVAHRITLSMAGDWLPAGRDQRTSVVL